MTAPELDRKLHKVLALPPGEQAIRCCRCGRLMLRGAACALVTVGILPDPAAEHGFWESTEVWCVPCAWPTRQRLAAWARRLWATWSGMADGL